MENMREISAAILWISAAILWTSAKELAAPYPLVTEPDPSADDKESGSILITLHGI
jgi:hypothetical protein